MYYKSLVVRTMDVSNKDLRFVRILLERNSLPNWLIRLKFLDNLSITGTIRSFFLSVFVSGYVYKAL